MVMEMLEMAERYGDGDGGMPEMEQAVVMEMEMAEMEQMVMEMEIPEFFFTGSQPYNYNWPVRHLGMGMGTLGW